MVIYQLGWHWEHPATLAIERPNGHFGTQVLLVQSRGRLIMGEKEYHVQKNTVFLIQSCVPHCIYGDGETYCDDWIRFSIEQEDTDFIDGLGLPFHVPIELHDDGVSELIKACETVFQSEANGKQETLHALLTALLLHIKGPELLRPRPRADPPGHLRGACARMEPPGDRVRAQSLRVALPAALQAALRRGLY